MSGDESGSNAGPKNGWLYSQVQDQIKSGVQQGLDSGVQAGMKAVGINPPDDSKPAAPKPLMALPKPVYGPPTDAYEWSRAACPSPFPPLTPATRPDKSGLTGWLDHRVEEALKASGLLGWLEKVTGNLDELNNAAEEWVAQAKAVQIVAEQLRAEVQPLAEQWQGAASDAFGQHMGEVAEALDSTAVTLYQTAQLINQAAQMCAMAESMVIEIISEAIESLIASLAVEAVVTVLTLGLGAIAGAMLDAVEISAFIARVAKVSEELAQNLEKLVEALKELRTAVKAVRTLKDAKEALSAVKDVKAAFKTLRGMEDGGDDLLKIAKDAKEAKSLKGVGGKVLDYGARQAAGAVDRQATSWAQDQFKQDVFGDPSGDSADTSGHVGIKRGEDGKISYGGTAWETAKSLGGSALNGAKGVATSAATSDLAMSAYEGEAASHLEGTRYAGVAGEAGNLVNGNFVGSTIDGLTGMDVGKKLKGVADAENDPAPYRVDKDRIEASFG